MNTLTWWSTAGWRRHVVWVFGEFRSKDGGQDLWIWRWNGVHADRHFYQRQTKRPNVALDWIMSPLESFRLCKETNPITIMLLVLLHLITHAYRHVTSGANKRVGHRIDQLSRNSKVANLDLSSTIDQNVAGFNIAVDDLVLVSQITQSFQYLKSLEINWLLPHVRKQLCCFNYGGCDFAEVRFRNSTGFLQYQVERSSVHVLHANTDFTVTTRCYLYLWKNDKFMEKYLDLIDIYL